MEKGRTEVFALLMEEFEKMPKMTPGLAKNTIRRVLYTVIDPEPTATEIDNIWKYFSNACAYCGEKLVKKNREGHIDHLVPIAQGGSNHVSNRVLACSSCNGDEKREGNWLDFLKKKGRNEAECESRQKCIYAWTLQNQRTCNVPSTEETEAIKEETEKVIQVFDTAVNNLRVFAKKRKEL